MIDVHAVQRGEDGREGGALRGVERGDALGEDGDAAFAGGAQRGPAGSGQLDGDDAGVGGVPAADREPVAFETLG
ncbi:hypothetical protein [Actinomadura atramentaria]|uniref:hypothetical protein n=1 Tax=Actinomadura atramentaria TaxID=1990 RepID=UPI00037F848D|nr:hypothetical protein [Actinomadura atramentaria]